MIAIDVTDPVRLFALLALVFLVGTLVGHTLGYGRGKQFDREQRRRRRVHEAHRLPVSTPLPSTVKVFLKERR